MSQVAYTIFEQGIGPRQIKRRGHCPKSLLGRVAQQGESVLVGQALCDLQHYVHVCPETLTRTVCKHPPEVIEAKAPGWHHEHHVDALTAKGIHPALARRLVQRRRDHAASLHAAGKSPARPLPAAPQRG